MYPVPPYTALCYRDTTGGGARGRSLSRYRSGFIVWSDELHAQVGQGTWTF